MASIIRPIIGSSTTAWQSAGFTAANFNSLANGSFVLAASAVAQSSNLDDYLDLSFSLVVGGTTTAASFLSLYLLPLNQDGTTYGDATATGSTPPGASYWMTNAFPAVGITSGNAIVGSFPRVFIGDLASDFKLGIVNNLGVALNASAAAAVKYLTINTNGNG